MAHFVRSFDCKNKDHVFWLKDVGQVMAKTMSGERIDLTSAVNNNPLPGKPSMENPADWAYIHFQLTMKYATAVLSCDAFVPTNKTEVLFEGEVSRV
jgi:hypothetical protein